MPTDPDPARDLLLALLAFQGRRVTPTQLRGAVDAWLGSGERSLADVLVERGALDESARDLLGSLAAKHLGRTEEGPADAPPAGEPSDHPDVPATVAYISAGPPAGSHGGSPTVADLPVVGRFRILRPHARGGLGEVYVALDAELGREVALKELRARHAHDPAIQERFLAEARLTGRLEHPGIAPVYGLGRHPDGRPYYAMRLIGGETLREAIDRFHSAATTRADPAARELAFRRLLRAVIDACNAVAYAHSRGVVHRDLKPENIMLGRFGETLVIDWGIAKAVPPFDAPAADPAPTPGPVVGTPRYMSPEQAEGDGDRVGPATDVYGLGATLYAVLVGRPPFPDGDVRTVLGLVRRGVFPTPRRARKTVHPELEAICLKAMAPEPSDRHASPLELAGALEAWLADVRYRVEQGRALGEARRSLARLCLERAFKLFDRERPPEGMLWLSRALENAPDDDPTLGRVARTGLAGWHARETLLQRSMYHLGPVCGLAFSPDGRTLATLCGGPAARLWDVSTGASLTPPLTHDGPVRGLAFGADGRAVWTAGDDATLRRWDALGGQPLGPPIAVGAPVACLHASPDGARLAALCEGGEPRLWDADTGRPVPLGSPPDCPAHALAFAPDGRRLAAACDDGLVRLWDAASGTALDPLPRHDASITCLAFAPDGHALLTGCRDGHARLWPLDRDGPPVALAHREAVGCVRFAPGGGAVATISLDGPARLWQAADGEPIGEPIEHRGRVADLAFDPSGSALATAGLDGSARLWDASTALPLGPPLAHRGSVACLAFSPDGRRLATGGSDGLARCWTVPEPVPGDPERVACWVRVSTGLDFHPGDALRPLDGPSGWELRRRLYELGGPPLH